VSSKDYDLAEIDDLLATKALPPPAK